jgi:hypothetical protein
LACWLSLNDILLEAQARRFTVSGHALGSADRECRACDWRAGVGLPSKVVSASTWMFGSIITQ